ALQNFRQQLAEGDAVGVFCGTQLHAGKICGARRLTKKIEEIIATGLHKPGAEENVVMNVVHTDGKRGHRKSKAVALELDSAGFRRAGRSEFSRHGWTTGAPVEASSEGKTEQGRWQVVVARELGAKGAVGHDYSTSPLCGVMDGPMTAG